MNVIKKFLSTESTFIKGLIVAVISAIVASCGQWAEVWLTQPTFAFNKMDLVLSLKAGIAAGLAYIFKNLITPAKSAVENENK